MNKSIPPLFIQKSGGQPIIQTTVLQNSLFFPYRYPTLIFERPSWKKLLAEVEAGNVENVIVKDA